MFATRLVAWQRRSGRNDLPWQQRLDPYPVWLSEVMLQQTQVSTVLRYFDRFLLRFPTVFALATATQEEVLAQWSGLGYYSRGRLLHACAQAVAARGEFPASSEILQGLPGIGPSTAAAIASICFGERVSIFDGNVQRVVARHAGFDGDLSVAAARRELHETARALLPRAPRADTMRRYTQGLMDLGATICTPRSPRCSDCPVSSDCRARSAGLEASLPKKSKRLKRSALSLWLLMTQRADGAIWLQQLPIDGIWGGLHAFPIFSSPAELDAVVGGAPSEAWPVLRHALTHKDLYLHPVLVHSPNWAAATQGVWWMPGRENAVGIPAPVARLIAQLTQARDGA